MRRRARRGENRARADYIEAIGAYYDHFGKQLRARMQSLADAFEALANRYGDNDKPQISARCTSPPLSRLPTMGGGGD